ncbi:hypothetical protein [Pseudonocardia sp. ICBG601]|uniref:hypothetical protein n=1 Tax=Pseudonocardia sp. ICBG601 TaxID=2846759 RepID=UPI001CF70D0F|nr:hypothetical protein [Pseudonocardia sp. ICBG601]
MARPPAIPDDVRSALQQHLGKARAEIGAGRRTATTTASPPPRTRVSAAKHGLGERGTPWWDLDDDARRERWETALRDLAD